MNLLNGCHAHHLGDNEGEFKRLGIHRRGRLLIIFDKAGGIELVVCVDAVLLLHLLLCRPVNLAHLALGRAQIALNLARSLAYVPKLCRAVTEEFLLCIQLLVNLDTRHQTYLLIVLLGNADIL